MIFLYVYSPRAGADSPPGDKVLMLTEMSCHHSFVASFKKKCLWPDFIQFFHDLIHVYRQGQTAPRGQNFDVNRKAYHFTHLLQISKKSLWSLILYNFFHDLIYVYSPCAGGIQPPGDKVLMSTETSCHFSHLLIVSNHRRQQFLKNPMFYPFPIQNIRDQMWPCCKIGQGQHRVIIWTNLIVLEQPMLHTKFQGHGPFGSREIF